MSKTKQLLDEDRGNQPIDYGKFLDDEYQEQQYHEEMKKIIDLTPIVSHCCEAPINILNVSSNNNLTYTVCTKCHNFCQEL